MKALFVLVVALLLTAQTVEAQWRPLSGGVTSTGYDVWATKVFNDELYVGGQFGSVDGISSNGIAKWDGSRWIALGSGTGHQSTTPIVWTIEAHGGNIYIGGTFTSVSGVQANNLARWNGSSWSNAGEGLPANTRVRTLRSFGNSLIAGGDTGIYVLNGSVWSILGGGVNGPVRETVVHNGELIVSGGFQVVGGSISQGGVVATGIARWNGATWSAFGDGLTSAGLSGDIVSLLSFGGSLIAGGSFSLVSGQRNTARWSGTMWLPVGESLGGPGLTICNCVRSLVGYGGRLIASGDFRTPIESVAASAGATWLPLGAGMPGATIHTTTVYRNELIVAGRFAIAGGVPARGIARWSDLPIFSAGFESVN